MDLGRRITTGWELGRKMGVRWMSRVCKRARGVLQRPVGFAGTRGDVGKDLLAASLPSLLRGCHNFMAINKICSYACCGNDMGN